MLVSYNKILVLYNKILVLFDMSIRIPRAHARIHKVFYPCNRCHLATLLENQRVTCDNEVTRVTTIGVFAKILHAGCEAPGFEGRRCRLQGSEVPPPWVGAPGSKGRRYGLHAPCVLQVADESLDLLSRLVGFLFVNLCRHDAAVLSMPVVTDVMILCCGTGIDTGRVGGHEECHLLHLCWCVDTM